MKVKDILIRALKYAGREDAADELTKGEVTDCKEAVETALYCFNAVEDEVARNYFPLVREDSLLNVKGSFAYTQFTRVPKRILLVSDGGGEIKFTQTSDGIKADSVAVTVRYEYLPVKKEVEDDSEFFGEHADEKLFAAGTASEFCLINGDVSQADYFESVYRSRIDALRIKGLAAFPPRRWV